MYEGSGGEGEGRAAPPLSEETCARVHAEAEHFVGMMYDLWDEGKSGELDAPTFDRAAHQHPLLVQAFNLEQLEMPPSAAGERGTLGAAQVRAKNGMYLGLRPGAVSVVNDSYF